jgi:uncharacterized protein (DUF1697 family)
MVYVALLRGINVGGKARIEMSILKAVFEELGFTNVKTYINSGNVVFATSQRDTVKLCQQIESAIEQKFGFAVPTLVCSQTQLASILENIPTSWTNDQQMRCDVLFLWSELDSPDIIERIPHKPEIEDVRYTPGAVVWRIDRANVKRGSMIKIIGTDVYKKITIRNINTVRKLSELM